MPHDPAPPFQLRNVQMLYLEGTLPLTVARRLLPPGFEPADTGAAMIAAYAAPDGWGLAPYTSLYARLALKGLDSPDGSEALYVLAETLSSPAAAIYARHINDQTWPGDTSFLAAEDRIDAAGPLAGGGHLALSARRLDPSARDIGTTAGAHTEITPKAGGFCEMLTAYSCRFEQVALDRIAWTLPPGHPMQPLRDHFTPTHCYFLFDKSFSNGVPRAFRPGAAPGRDPDPATMDLLGRLNLPALVLRRDGGLAHATDAARQQGAARLEHLLSALRQRLLRSPAGDGPGMTLHLPLPDGGAEIARLIPLPPSLWSAPSVLCLLTDLNRGNGTDPLPLLSLLGLTPAEARIALPLATGASAPQVAARLGISPHTVRSSLKAIYGKLGISSRAELARLVDRLGGA